MSHKSNHILEDFRKTHEREVMSKALFPNYGVDSYQYFEQN